MRDEQEKDRSPLESSQSDIKTWFETAAKKFGSIDYLIVFYAAGEMARSKAETSVVASVVALLVSNGIFHVKLGVLEWSEVRKMQVEWLQPSGSQ